MADTVSPVTAGALLLGALAVFVAAPAGAQGKSKEPHGHGTPPSSSPLPIATAAPPGLGAMPLAWVDDANLMESGAMSVDIATSRWEGNGVGETDAPVFNIGVGLTNRLQFTASVPRVVDDPTAGVVGGLGTTYFSLKYAAWADDRLGIRVAVAPTLEVLGAGVLQSLGPNDARTQIGLPVSVELDRGGRRFYASSGWFSRGVWFAGAGAGVQATERIGISASFSHAWTTTPLDAAGVVARDRTEVSGGLSYAVASHVALFGTVGRTIATLDENGAGTTVSGGISFYVSPSPHPGRRP